MDDEPILRAVASVIKDHVGKAFASLSGKINEIEQRFKELPQPQQGPPGPPGPAGASGKDGAPGEQGIAGSSGADGKAGQDGARGADGIAGEPGKDGANGIDGAKGNDGAAGKDGADGLNGKDAPAVDTEALSAAIVQKVLGLIPEPKPGLDGKDGASVDLDAVRILVAGEVNKAIAAIPKPEPGRDGRAGIDGKTGMAGKDAADIDPIDGIDESAAYPRGTWALHRGGTIYAYRTTDPIEGGTLQSAGWRVVQEGILDVVKSMAADERTEITTVVLTSGKTIVNSVKTFALIHRDTWKEDGEYERGDTVTHAGSTWHAQKTTKGDRPATSSAWKLMTKRGSDGKDLTNGARQ